MQTARKLDDKDLCSAAMGNDEIIVSALYGRIDNKLGKIEALMPGFFNGVIETILQRFPFFADYPQPATETNAITTVVEFKDFDAQLDEIIRALNFSAQGGVGTKFLEAFDRLSDCTQANVAHLIYGFLLAESWERSTKVRSLIAEKMLKIDQLSPGFGVAVIPVLWQGGQEDDKDNPISKCIPPQDQLHALYQFSDALELLAKLLENGKVGSAAEKFNSLYTTLPAGAKEMLLDVLAAVGEEMVGADTLYALIE